MNKGMLTVGIIMLAVIALVLINVITSYSTGNELDYYLVKETTEAAMEDATDNEYLRLYGAVRMDKEKFVESFIRRFADTVDVNRNYQVAFYDINEVPPKVSVKVDSSTVLSFEGSNIEMSTTMDGILESGNKTDIYLDKAIDNGLGNPTK